VGESIFDIHHRHGVKVVARDVVAEGVSDLNVRLDVVTCFDSMEHWHRSPKALLHSLVSMLNPNGRLVLGVPNCVNLRKRLTVPFGRGKWTSMKDWYEPEIFRSHVREPDVEDLLYIADDLKLKNVQIYGRNWLGYQSKNKLMRQFTGLADTLLRLRPSLCSNIYLVGERQVL